MPIHALDARPRLAHELLQPALLLRVPVMPRIARDQRAGLRLCLGSRGRRDAELHAADAVFAQLAQAQELGHSDATGVGGVFGVAGGRGEARCGQRGGGGRGDGGRRRGALAVDFAFL